MNACLFCNQRFGKISLKNCVRILMIKQSTSCESIEHQTLRVQYVKIATRCKLVKRKKQTPYCPPYKMDNNCNVVKNDNVRMSNVSNTHDTLSIRGQRIRLQSRTKKSIRSPTRNPVHHATV